MKLLFPVIVFLAIISCTKPELKSADIVINSGCLSTSKAYVRKESLNETSSDYFYYLEVDEMISGSYSVFPDLLPQTLQEEGRRINIQFSSTKVKHTYSHLSTGCGGSQSTEPNTAQSLSMPMILVCNATPVL